MGGAAYLARPDFPARGRPAQGDRLRGDGPRKRTISPFMSAPRPLVLLRRRLGLFPPGAPSSPEGALAATDAPGERDGRMLGEPTPLVMERAAWSLVWLGILVGGVELWGDWWSWPFIDVLAPLLVVVGLAGMVFCWWGPTPRSWLHQGVAMAGAVIAMGAPQVVSLHTRIYYSTDSAALDHVAARLLADGHNPYVSSLASARLLLQTPQDYWTYTVTGGHVAGVSYPAGSFLIYAPAFALGFRHLVVDWMDLYAWLASAVLLFFMLPRSLRWIAGLVTLVGIFTAIASGGGTDAVFIPFAMVAVWRWDRFGGRGAGLAGWIGPVALGLACSIKQTPWFFAPFLLIGVCIEARRDGRPVVAIGARYVALTAAAFLAVNLPFVVLSPHQWWHDSLLPFTQPLVADGQGIVSLALHGLTGGANLGMLDLASLIALVAVLVAFVAWYRVLKRAWLLVLPAAFFFAPRSFTSYLIDFFPMALVGLLTVEPAGSAAVAAWRWGPFQVSRLAVAVLSATTGVLSAVALTSRPLDVSYLTASVGPEQQHLFDVVVEVTNTTTQTVRPRFLVNINAPHPAGFWTTPHHRPVVLRPHQSATPWRCSRLSPPTCPRGPSTSSSTLTSAIRALSARPTTSGTTTSQRSPPPSSGRRGPRASRSGSEPPVTGGRRPRWPGPGRRRPDPRSRRCRAPRAPRPLPPPHRERSTRTRSRPRSGSPLRPRARSPTASARRRAR